MNYKNINIKKRMFLMLCVFFALLIYMAGRLFYWQIIKAEWIQKKAVNQWTDETMVSALRGEIVDSNGMGLSRSGTSDTVIARPQSITEEAREKVAKGLSETLGLDYQKVLDQISQNVGQVTIARQVDIETATKVKALSLTGVDFSIETRRYYPMRNLAAQLIGYTNIDGVGQEGLEAKYNKYLAGKKGKKISEIDAKNRGLPSGAEQYIPAENGSTLVLTIDAVMQSIMDAATQECLEVNNAKSVQGIAMNAKTGEVLAITTKPDFDLNNLSDIRKDGELLRSLSRNRVITDAYEPGSTFKIITLASGLESGATSVNATYNCSGFKIVEGQRIKCWRTTPHGHETLAEGVQNSCNPVFMEIALAEGTDTFYEYLDAFGFNSPTGIDLVGESSGIVRQKKLIKNFDLARIGFGQSISVTPVQLVTAVSAAVNGGNLMKPYVVKEIIAPDGTLIEQTTPTVVRRVISEETSKTVAELLEGVVKNGSGRNAYIPGYRVGGKTGTAQKYENNKIAQGKYVASFVGFAPADDPEIVVLILVDEPKISSQVFGGTVAAPYVREVLYKSLRQLKINPQYVEGEEEFNLEIVVPNLKDKLLDEAVTEIKAAKLDYIADGKGLIVNQVPQAGAKVPQGTGILLYTTIPDIDQEDAFENDTVGVPNVIGKTLSDAYDILAKAGLTAESVGDPNGRISAQVPVAGTSVQTGSSVMLTVTVAQ